MIDFTVKPYLFLDFKPSLKFKDFLKTEIVVLARYCQDSQRYFDHHHAANDAFEAVHKRELELGAATMTSLIYLIDKYGTIQPKKIKGK